MTIASELMPGSTRELAGIEQGVRAAALLRRMQQVLGFGRLDERPPVHR
jgi:hypothetical protein